MISGSAYSSGCKTWCVFLTVLNTSIPDVSIKTNFQFNIWALLWFPLCYDYLCAMVSPWCCVSHLSFVISSNKVAWGFIPFISQGNGLVNLEGSKWFQHRCLLTPGFNVNILKSYIKVMAHSVNTMLVSEGKKSALMCSRMFPKRNVFHICSG